MLLGYPSTSERSNQINITEAVVFRVSLRLVVKGAQPGPFTMNYSHPLGTVQKQYSRFKDNHQNE